MRLTMRAWPMGLPIETGVPDIPESAAAGQSGLNQPAQHFGDHAVGMGLRRQADR
jgi:hypothetical protein